MEKPKGQDQKRIDHGILPHRGGWCGLADLGPPKQGAYLDQGLQALLLWAACYGRVISRIAPWRAREGSAGAGPGRASRSRRAYPRRNTSGKGRIQGGM